MTNDKMTSFLGLSIAYFHKSAYNFANQNINSTHFQANPNQIKLTFKSFQLINRNKFDKPLSFDTRGGLR